MANDRKKQASSSFPARPSPNKPTGTSKVPVEEIEQALGAALEAGDDTRALEVLDAAPRWVKKQPKFMLIHASLLLSLGDDQQAFQILREVERKFPRYMALYLPLSLFYPIVWQYPDPKNIPDQLRISGLVYSGVLEGQPVAFIPADVRLLLRKLLK